MSWQQYSMELSVCLHLTASVSPVLMSEEPSWIPPTSEPRSGLSCLSFTAPKTAPLWKPLLWPQGPLARAGLLKAPGLLTRPLSHAAEAVVYLGPACLGSASPTVLPWEGSCFFCVAGC